MIYVSAYLKDDSDYLLCTSKPLFVNSIGYYHNIDTTFNSVYREIGREDYQIIYVSKGKGYFIFNEKEHTIEEGSIVIYKPNEKQNYMYKSTDKSNIYWIHFSGKEVCNILNKFEIYDNNIYNIGFNDEYIKIWEKIILEIQKKELHFEYIIQSELSKLLILMARGIYEHKNNFSKTHELVQIAINKMHQEQYKNIMISDYAKEYNMSVCWFIKNFKEITGMTPNKYISHMKINKAKELLFDTGLNITEISDMLGFESPFYFSKVFKKIIGQSPKEWKNTAKN